MRCIAAIFCISALLGWSVPSTAETVVIKNSRGEKVKLCTYRTDDKSLIRPRKCWTFNKGQEINWDRGDDRFAYDIRLFGPGVFELPICFRSGIAGNYRIEITPRETKTCVETRQRTKVPPQTWTDGARILANREQDNFWYPGTILQKVGDRYRIRFDDIRLGVFEPNLIADLILTDAMKIEVNWKRQGRWYPVRFLSLEQGEVQVMFEDGKRETAPTAQVRVDLTAK